MNIPYTNPDEDVNLQSVYKGLEDAKAGRLGPAPEDFSKYVEEEMEGQVDVNTGKKHDDGKPPLALLSSSALIEIAKVLDFGAKKYDPWNWKGGFKWSRVASAVLRHIFAWLGGEDKDPETGLSHIAHAGCGILFILDFEVNKLGTDDRYAK